MPQPNCGPDPSPNARWFVVFLLFSGTFINAVDRASLSASAPSMMRELGLDKALMGVALSAFFWAYLPLNIPAGLATDKFGAKKVLGLAAVLWAVCSGLTGVASRYGHVLAVRLGVGAGEAATFPVNTRILSASFSSRQRGLAMSFCTSGLRLGFAVTPLLMAGLISRWGWRTAFYVTGAGSLLWAAVWWVAYSDTIAPRPLRNAVGDSLRHGGAGATPSVLRSWSELLKSRTLLGLVLCKFFQDYLFYVFVTWLPGYLVLERGFTILNMGWCASLPWLAGFFVQPLAGWASDALLRRGCTTTVSRKSIMIIMQLLAAPVVLAGPAKSPTVAVLLLSLSVACESASTALLWTACADIAPRHAAGSLAGIMNTAGALAGVLAPALTGLLVQTTGSFQSALAAASAAIVLAALAIGFVAGRIEPLDQGILRKEEQRSRVSNPG